MTGYDIFKRVCGLLGYEGFFENADESKSVSFLYILNQIISDLKLPEVGALSSVVDLSQKQKESVVYGCAMLLAGNLNDMALANTFTQLYNGKRNGILCENTTRQDVIPTPSGGGN